MTEERNVTFAEKVTDAEMGMIVQIVTAIFSFEDLLGEKNCQVSAF